MESKNSVSELTQDLDQLASRFRNRFQNNGDTGKDALDGDTGKDALDGDTGKAFISSVSSTENLIRDLDQLSQRYQNLGKFSNGDTGKDGGDGDTGKGGILDIRANLGPLFKDIDVLADRYRNRFPSTLDGDTGKDAGVISGHLDSLFGDLDNLAARYRDRFDKLAADGDTGKGDAADGDTGKDAELFQASQGIGRLIGDLDNLAERYKTRLSSFDGDGDTGKGGEPNALNPQDPVINWPYIGVAIAIGVVLGAIVF